MRKLVLAVFLPSLLACAGTIESAMRDQLADPAQRKEILGEFSRNMTTTCIEEQLEAGGDAAQAAIQCQ